LLALDLRRAEDIAARLRRAEIPIVCRIQQAQLLFDPRTVAPEEDEKLLSALLNLKHDV
jgi:hypothetical protein